MNKKKIGLAAALALVLVAGFLVVKRIMPDDYVPAGDEIALHIQLNTNEDIGFLVFDYRADDYESSGGVSNANRSLMKRNSTIIHVWNQQELSSDSDAVELSVRIRVITEYVNPNFENIYPDDITQYLDPLSWNARFGETYSITITGDRLNGYEAVLNQ